MVGLMAATTVEAPNPSQTTTKTGSSDDPASLSSNHITTALTWFKSASATDRLELSHSLLLSCTPIELRFLAICIEDLAQRDAPVFQEADRRTNEDSSFIDLPTNPLLTPPSRYIATPEPTEPRQNGIGSAGDDNLTNGDRASSPSNSETSSGAGPNGPLPPPPPPPSCIQQLVDATCRSKLVVSTALLRSRNSVSGQKLGRLLLEAAPAALQLVAFLGVSDVTEELTLLYSMAFRHPALAFLQRLQLAHVAALLQQARSHRVSSASANGVSAHTAAPATATTPTTSAPPTTFADAVARRTPGSGGRAAGSSTASPAVAQPRVEVELAGVPPPAQPPEDGQDQVVTNSSVNSIDLSHSSESTLSVNSNPTSLSNTRVNSRQNTSSPDTTQQQHNRDSQNAHLESINVKSCYRCGLERFHTFFLEITWSDSSHSNVARSLGEIENMHRQLKVALSKFKLGGSNGVLQDDNCIVLPVFLSEKMVSSGADVFLPHLREYFRRVAALPEELLHAGQVITFLTNDSPPAAAANSGPLPCAGAPLPPGCCSSFNPVGPPPPLGYAVAQSMAQPHPPQVYTRSPPPTFVPVSSVQDKLQINGLADMSTCGSDPALYNQCGVSPQNNVEPAYSKRLAVWLKQQRMHKYYDRLIKYSFDELLLLDRDALETENFTQGAITKLLGMLDALKKDHGLLWNSCCTGGSGGSASSRSPLSSPGGPPLQAGRTSPSSDTSSSARESLGTPPPFPVPVLRSLPPPPQMPFNQIPMPMACACPMCQSVTWVPAPQPALPMHLPAQPQPQAHKLSGCYRCGNPGHKAADCRELIDHGLAPPVYQLQLN